MQHKDITRKAKVRRLELLQSLVHNCFVSLKLFILGLLMDGGFSNKDINLNKEFITEGNILNLFAKYNVSRNFDVLSIDVDLFDWWILAKILRDSDYRPKIIIVETNPTLCLNVSFLYVRLSLFSTALLPL